MWFKNLSFFRLPEQFTVPEDFDELLAPLVLKPLGSVELFSRGFIPPLGPEHPLLSHALQGARLVRLGTEEKLLPGSVVKQEVERRARAIEERDGRRPGKKQREQLKDDVVAEFTQRAFVKSGVVNGYLDVEARMLIVDSASDKAAEKLITALREALTTFAVEPAATEESVTVILSEWVKEGQGHHGFVLGDEIELKDPVEPKTTIKAKRHDLTSEEIRDHVLAGKQVSQLALIFDDRIGFTLDDKLKVRRLRFLDLVMDEMGDGGGDAAGEFDARFALMTLEVRRLLDALHTVFKLH